MESSPPERQHEREREREREDDEDPNLPPIKKLKTNDEAPGGEDNDGASTNNANDVKGDSNNPTTTSNPEDDTRKCELCQRDRPRSCYGKKQWNKAYGGWNCQDCSAEQRAQQRSDLQELSQQDKQNRHDQKIADQTAKTNGTFSTQRRCLTCHSTKERISYSGKQWKQLFRECQDCVQIRVNDSNNPHLPPRAKANTANTAASTNSIVDRLCSSCCQIKQRPDFSPKQWKNLQDAERLCKDCWAEEEVAKEEHRTIITEATTHKNNAYDSKTQKRCFACHNFKFQYDYSKKQFSKLYGICTPCVVILQDDRRRQKTTRICSMCHISKQWDDFAHEQRKATKTERRCRTCAVAHVQDRAEHRQAERDQTQEGLRRCYTCKTFATEEGFSGRQWTKTYAICKTCCSEKEKAVLEKSVVVAEEEENNSSNSSQIPENEKETTAEESNTPETDNQEKEEPKIKV